MLKRVYFGAIKNECSVYAPKSLPVLTMQQVYTRSGLQDRYQDVSYVMDGTSQRVLVCELVMGSGD